VKEKAITSFPAVINPPDGADTVIEDDGRLYSLFFQQAPLLQVVQSLIKEGALSLTVERDVDVERPITVTLNDVPLAGALEMVVAGAAGYAWRIENHTLIVSRFAERIYYLDHPNLPGETLVEVGGDMLASSVEQAGVAGSFAVKTERKGDNGDMWQGIESALKGLKSKEGILQVNPNTGIIYLQDTPAKIDAMVRLLDAVAAMLHRQVFIEAKILEVRLDDEHKHGIDWSALDLGFSSSSSSFALGSGISFNGGSAVTLTDQDRFNAIVDFLETRGDVSVLSNPHIAVMNGQSAIMTVGFQFPYGDVTGVDRDTQTGLISYGTAIKRAILGLQLGITPYISAEGLVTMQIVPTITRIQGYEKVEIPTSSTTTQTISNPIIDLQELATTVRAHAGESVVLAGLISQMQRTDSTGLPWLARIPFLGFVAGHHTRETQNRELVILLTPYVQAD
jgi:MSHA type pilus biogenesis protein MshL